MSLIAFDSNICIWCIKEECTPGQEVEMQAAIKLRKLLTKAGYDILIPIPVVSELLSNIPDVTQRQALFNEIKRTFQIAEFDAKASLLLAEILNYHFITSNKQYKTLGITKTALKYDALIVATSKAHGAECLFAYDPDCKKIAVHFLPVKDLNERPDSISQNIGVFEDLPDLPLELPTSDFGMLKHNSDHEHVNLINKSPKIQTNDQVENTEEGSTKATPGELPTEIINQGEHSAK